MLIFGGGLEILVQNLFPFSPIVYPGEGKLIVYIIAMIGSSTNPSETLPVMTTKFR